MMTSYVELLAQLEASRARVESGQPMSEEELRALESDLTLPLDSSYLAFLRSVGALRIRTDLAGLYSDLRVFGSSNDPKIDVRAARAALAQAKEDWWWGQPAQPIVPLLGYGVNAFARRNEFGDEGYVFYQGAVHHLHRGHLEPRDSSFAACLARVLKNLEAELAAHAKMEHEREALALRLSAVVGAESIERTAEGAIWRCGEHSVNLTLARFEAGAEDPGVFATWSEGGLDFAEVNARNRAAWLACGYLDNVGIAQFRARLLWQGLAVESFLAALAHDLQAPLHLSLPQAPSIREIQTGLEKRAPVSPEERLLDAIFGAPTDQEPLYSQEGDALFGPAIVDRKAPERSPRVRISVGPTGLIHVEHRRPRDASSESLQATNAINRADQLDLSSAHIRLFLDGDHLGFAFTEASASVAAGHFSDLLRHLERRTRVM